MRSAQVSRPIPESVQNNRRPTTGRSLRPNEVIVIGHTPVFFVSMQNPDESRTQEHRFVP